MVLMVPVVDVLCVCIILTINRLLYLRVFSFFYGREMFKASLTASMLRMSHILDILNCNVNGNFLFSWKTGKLCFFYVSVYSE
jgi:hypothetical protein